MGSVAFTRLGRGALAFTRGAATWRLLMVLPPGLGIQTARCGARVVTPTPGILLLLLLLLTLQSCVLRHLPVQHRIFLSGIELEIVVISSKVVRVGAGVGE